jgi:WD40 repeat protein
LNPQTGEIVHTLSGYAGNCNSIAFHPDGKTLYSVGERWPGEGEKERTFVLWDMRTGKPREVFAFGIDGSIPTRTLAVSPDGSQVAIHNGTNLDMRSGSSGVIQSSFPIPTGHETTSAFSPDGHTLVRPSITGVVRLIDLRRHYMHQEIRLAPHGAIDQALYTPDGRHIIITNGNGTVYVLRLQEWSPDLGNDSEK